MVFGERGANNNNKKHIFDNIQRGLAIRFPLTASLFAAFLFLVILALILGSCTLPTVIRISLQQFDNAKSYPRIKSEPLRPISEVKSTRRRRKSRSSRSSSERRVTTLSDTVSAFLILSLNRRSKRKHHSLPSRHPQLVRRIDYAVVHRLQRGQMDFRTQIRSTFFEDSLSCCITSYAYKSIGDLLL